ncbi:MAG TPA: TrfB-related DNA-binding protein [Candidatus Limnocylindrales bacterium]
MDEASGVVVFGDVVRSRNDPTGASEWLRALRDRLDAEYGEMRLAPFGFTQGDELQGLLRRDADALRAVLVASLDPAGRPMRWAIAEGGIEPGSGPATERTGTAFLAAREAIDGPAARDGLVIVTGVREADRLLERIAPPLAELLGDLTDRQRVVAHGILVDGLRQADVAARLGVSRATISVTYARGRIRSIERLSAAVRLVIADARQTGSEGHHDRSLDVRPGWTTPAGIKGLPDDASGRRGPA